MSAAAARIRTYTIGVAAALVVLACAASESSARAEKKTKASGAPSVQITLKLANDRFIVGEDIAMHVSVTNDAATDVSIPDPFHRDNWQPTYTVTGTNWPEERTFSFRSFALKDTRPNPEDLEPVLLTLHSGQTVESDIPLRTWASIGEPGDYRVTAALDWKGVAARSAPTHFVVQRADVQSASVGIDVAAAGTPGDWVEWFKKEQSGQRLYSSMFTRPHADVHGYTPFSVQPIHTAAPQATDLLLPWTNYNRQAELAKWRVWREGSSLVGLVTGLTEPSRLNLGATPDRVVRPALMTEQGELDVFVLSQATVSLAHFPPPNWNGPASPAKIAWKSTLPATPIAARAALAPQQAGSERKLLVVTSDAGGIAVHFMNAGSGAAAGSWQSVRVPNVTAINNTEPGLLVAEDGTTRAAVIVETNATTRDFGVVDLTFDRQGRPVGTPAVSPLGRLPIAARAAAATYTITRDAVRRDWFVLLENGSAMHSASGGNARQLRSAPLVPLQLVALSSSTYVLALDANGKPEFVLLD